MREYLKIRDDVDLKELEKFGFRYNKKDECYERICGRYEDEILEVDKGRNIYIYIDTEYWHNYTETETLIIIFDLISAGLVEKVVEDE